MVEPRPAAEVVVDAALVRALLAEQHPDLAELPLAELGSGWDNQLFRVGDALTVRLPRRELGAELILAEQRWLPELAPALPAAGAGTRANGSARAGLSVALERVPVASGRGGRGG